MGFRKVRSKNSEVLKERRLYSAENKKEYTQKQKNSCIGVVYTKKCANKRSDFFILSTQLIF